MTNEKDMGFLEHLEELRWHAIRAISSVFVFSIMAFIYKDFFFDKLVLGPSKTQFITYQVLCQLSEATCIDKLSFELINRSLMGQFMTHMTYSIVTGIVLAFPYVFWEFWRFIKPALHHEEKNAAGGATFFVTILFALGVTFGYLVVAPLAINFLGNYQLDPSIKNQIDLMSYVSTLVILVLACGLMFQLPVAVYVLSKIGVLTPTFMRQYRRHAVMVILILSAVITPSPDMISQLLVAIPVYFLYEMSVFISAYVQTQNQKALATLE
jgi:sec-independent protein translocase protein TatC